MDLLTPGETAAQASGSTGHRSANCGPVRSEHTSLVTEARSFMSLALKLRRGQVCLLEHVVIMQGSHGACRL